MPSGPIDLLSFRVSSCFSTPEVETVMVEIRGTEGYRSGIGFCRFSTVCTSEKCCDRMPAFSTQVRSLPDALLQLKAMGEAFLLRMALKKDFLLSLCSAALFRYAVCFPVRRVFKLRRHSKKESLRVGDG